MPGATISSADIDLDPFSEAKFVADAWIKHAGQLPMPVQGLLEAGRYLDATIELARSAIGQPPLVGWKMRFTSAGGPYEVELIFGGSRATVIGCSDHALSAAFVNAISNCGGLGLEEISCPSSRSLDVDSV